MSISMFITMLKNVPTRELVNERGDEIKNADEFASILEQVRAHRYLTDEAGEMPFLIKIKLK